MRENYGTWSGSITWPQLTYSFLISPTHFPLKSPWPRFAKRLTSGPMGQCGHTPILNRLLRVQDGVQTWWQLCWQGAIKETENKGGCLKKNSLSLTGSQWSGLTCSCFPRFIMTSAKCLRRHGYNTRKLPVHRSQKKYMWIDHFVTSLYLCRVKFGWHIAAF